MKINSNNNLLYLNVPKKNIFLEKFNIQGSISPLKKDTFSFSGSSTLSCTASKKINNANRPNTATALKIYEDAQGDYKQFKYILSQIFKMPILDCNERAYEKKWNRLIEQNKNKPIIMITSREKSQSSIMEKMATSGIKNATEAKERIHDIIGARILLSGNSQNEGDYVLSKLMEASKENKIKIEEIKIHSQDDKKLNYASNEKIDSAVKLFKKKNKNFKYRNVPRDSGYLAIHVIVSGLSNGYKGEIQITGLEVAKFKEVEDLCYKCMCGKNISEKYREIQKDFKPVQENPRIMEQYIEYTKRAYAHERLKLKHKQGMYEEFLPIPSNFDLIPKNLDFNVIASKKKRIDSR